MTATTTVTPWVKLFAIGLVAWGLLGSQASGNLDGLLLIMLLALLSVLDAGQFARPGKKESGRQGDGQKVTDADIGAVVRRLLGVQVGKRGQGKRGQGANN